MPSAFTRLPGPDPSLFRFPLPRRAFLETTGKGLALAGVTALLPGCGGGGDNNGEGAPSPGAPAPTIPSPDAAYLQLRRTSYGVTQTEMTAASTDPDGYL
ncbi:MAG: hypothetical protein RLN67_08175, partial [Algiphilus sp.]